MRAITHDSGSVVSSNVSLREDDLVAPRADREPEPRLCPSHAHRVARVELGGQLLPSTRITLRLTASARLGTRPHVHFATYASAARPVLAARELPDAEVDECARTRRELGRFGGRARRLRPHDGHVG